jgi:hypothetical protein
MANTKSITLYIIAFLWYFIQTVQHIDEIILQLQD